MVREKYNQRYGNANRAAFKLLIRVKQVTQGWGLLCHRFDLIMQEGGKKKITMLPNIA